jgi:hypothetical protein
MRYTLAPNARAARAPSLELCRAVGLAAVATEFNLQIDTLEPEAAGVAGSRVAALLRAGYGLRGRGSRSNRRFGWVSSRAEARHAETRSQRAARRSFGSGTSISKTTAFCS